VSRKSEVNETAEGVMTAEGQIAQTIKKTKELEEHGKRNIRRSVASNFKLRENCRSEAT